MSEFEEAKKKIQIRQSQRQQQEATQLQQQQDQEHQQKQLEETRNRNFDFLIPLIPSILSEANKSIFDGQAVIVPWHLTTKECTFTVGTETSDGYPTAVSVPGRLEIKSCQIKIPNLGQIEIYYPTRQWQAKGKRLVKRILRESVLVDSWEEVLIDEPHLYLKSTKKSKFKSCSQDRDDHEYFNLMKIDFAQKEGIVLTQFREILASRLISLCT